MDFFELATKNSKNLEEEYEKLGQRSGRKSLKAFTNLVQEGWTISINMRLCALSNFLASEKYLNIHELKAEQEKRIKKMNRDSVSTGTALHKSLGQWCRRRTAFDNSFEDGDKFKYAAMNVGGLGVSHFGEWCVVIKRQASTQFSSLAFIKDDSLKYIDDDHLDVGRLSNDLAVWKYVHLLAALKHETDMNETSLDEWPSRICCNNSYIEAVVKDDMCADQVASVRLKASDYYSYFEDLLKDFYADLPESDRYRLYMFLVALQLLEKHKISLEVIKENEH